MFYIINAKGEVAGSASGPVNTNDLGRYGSIAVASELRLPPDEVRVTGFPARPRIVAQPKAKPPVLTLSTTASDDDGDGIAELKADGRSSAAITATAKTADGELIEHPVPVTFRTTGGRLSARTAELAEGVASVKLTAGRETVLVEVTATAPGFVGAQLRFELVP